MILLFAQSSEASSLGAGLRALASMPNTSETLNMVRLSHAKELLGKYYEKSVVKAGEQLSEVEEFIGDRVKKALGSEWKKQADAVAKAIIEESTRYKFDPVFLMAVIENESSFNPKALGTSGEIGLMQIRPATGKWIAEKYNIRWKGEKSLRDPVTNIKIGAAYLAMLREKFDSDGRLYLAAYNMGVKNVKIALEKQIRPKDYTSRVMQRYVRLYTELKEEISAM